MNTEAIHAALASAIHELVRAEVREAVLGLQDFLAKGVTDSVAKEIAKDQASLLSRYEKAPCTDVPEEKPKAAKKKAPKPTPAPELSQTHAILEKLADDATKPKASKISQQEFLTTLQTLAPKCSDGGQKLFQGLSAKLGVSKMSDMPANSDWGKLLETVLAPLVKELYTKDVKGMWVTA